MTAAVPSIGNKTQKPLRVPLPRGKVLHLGPGKTGQISSDAADHPPLKALVDGGTVEIVDESAAPAARGGMGRQGRGPLVGHTSGGGGRRSGDR